MIQVPFITPSTQISSIHSRGSLNNGAPKRDAAHGRRDTEHFSPSRTNTTTLTIAEAMCQKTILKIKCTGCPLGRHPTVIMPPLLHKDPKSHQPTPIPR